MNRFLSALLEIWDLIPISFFVDLFVDIEILHKDLDKIRQTLYIIM